MTDYWHISEIPKGWTIGERVGAAKAMRGVGVQSNPNPALVTHMRPIIPTTYDEEGVANQTAQDPLDGRSGFLLVICQVFF